VELERPLHPQVVPGAAADERDLGAEHRIRAAHDLLLIPGEAVGQQHQQPMRPLGVARRAERDLRPGLAQPARRALGRGGRDRETLAAEGEHDDARISRPVRRDLARGRAADQRNSGRPLRDSSDQLVQVVVVGAEDGQQLRVVARERGACGGRAGRAGIRLVRASDRDPAT
jgi:hypothetical protein